MTVEERFWSKVNKTETCWLWIGSQDSKGYGMFYAVSKRIHAYRFSYELLVGEIPEGLCIDHLCRVPLCVNPEHLEAVTQTENKRRGMGFAGINSRKTHCDNGHEFTPENTYYQHGNPAWRGCIACRHKTQTEQALKWREKNLARAKAKRRKHKIPCARCHKDFYPVNAKHKYCGSIGSKTGCSYLKTLKANKI